MGKGRSYLILGFMVGGIAASEITCVVASLMVRHSAYDLIEILAKTFTGPDGKIQLFALIQHQWIDSSSSSCTEVVGNISDSLNEILKRRS